LWLLEAGWLLFGVALRRCGAAVFGVWSGLGRAAPADLLVLCEEVLDAARGNHPDRPFEQRLCGDLKIECDPVRIHQMLSNLLMNAVQYGDPAFPVILEATGDEQRITVKVANFGEAIQASDLNSIFEPLIQIPRAKVRASGRTQSSVGLGLFIVREIVQGHHGTVSVRSSAEAGTVFTVELPKSPIAFAG
jgi:signal transduction histidine kinase